MQSERHNPSDDDEFLTLAEVCAFFGGKGKPLHPSTLYRGIAAGRLPPPVSPTPNTRRWTKSACIAARKAIIAEGAARRGPEAV